MTAELDPSRPNPDPIAECPTCAGSGWDDLFGNPCDCARFVGTTSLAERLAGSAGSYDPSTDRAWKPGDRLDGRSFGARTTSSTRTTRQTDGALAGPDVADLAAWLSEQTWSEFATSLAAQWTRTGRLSPKQVDAGTRMREKCEARRAERAAERTQRADALATGTEPEPRRPRLTPSELDLSTIPVWPTSNAATYGVPGSDSRLKVRIEHGAAGTKWQGWIFVKDGAEYGRARNYGRQRPGETYSGDIADALAAIVADPLAAAIRYAELTGSCAICGAHLEDAESIAAGMGPICRSRFGA